MSDNNNFDDIEFINLDDTGTDSISNPPVSEYHNADEADDIFEEAARHHTSTVDDDDYDEPVRKPKSSTTRAERRRRRRRKLLIRRAVFCGALIVFIVSATMLISALLDYNKADKIYADIENSVFAGGSNVKTTVAANENIPSESTAADGSTTGTSAAEPETAFQPLKNYDHAALLALNSESVGYLQIPALDILLPVVQGTDNEYYLSHTLTGETSKNGTLFIDCTSTEGIESQNAIIYGHNMKNGSMFGTLRKFMDSDFFSKGENKYFYFYIEDKIYKYEIYSVHTTPAVSETYTTAFYSTDAFFTYIDTMLKASYHTSTLDFIEDSKTITLSTCTNDDNVRLVVQALRIEELLQ